jgi:hypothetical protein
MAKRKDAGHFPAQQRAREKAWKLLLYNFVI